MADLNDEILVGMIDEVFELAEDVINDLEETNEIELPADDSTIPEEDTDSGQASDDTPETVLAGDLVEPDEEDIITEQLENDLTEYAVAVLESLVTPIIENQSTLPTIGNVEAGDRVMIALINGLPTVLGTVGSGDRQEQEINTISADVAVLGTVVAGKASISDLNAATARITNLEANKADITDLNATNALVLNLRTTKAAISDLQATNANVTALQASKANVTELNAAKGRITTLEGDYANLNTVVAGKVDTNTLTANYITASQIATDYAKVDATNINTATIRNAWVDKVMVQSGLLAHQGTVYTLDAIQLNADRITAGTIDVQRLIVTVDGHKYMVQFDAQGTPSYQKLDGDIIQDLTITADKIVAGAVTALKITTANIVGTGGWINLRNGTFNYNNATSGLGISWDGTNLSITASSINIGANDVMTSINNVQDAVDNIKIGGRNLWLNTLYPNVTSPESYPRMVGQTDYTRVASTANNNVEVAEHGIKNIVKKAGKRPRFDFGLLNNTNGFENGQTYTVSFDWTAKLFSSDTDTTTKYLGFYIYDNHTGSNKINEACTDRFFPITTNLKGVEQSGRMEFTFTTEESATAIRISIMGNADAGQAIGDYFELRNMKLEKGNKATGWTPAPLDIDASLETANSNASTALSTASTADSNATTALNTANTASTTANTANSNASSALSTANTANSNASSALSTANNANTNASTALSTANTANSTANLAKTAILNVQTLIRLYSSGVLVCKTNNTVGALVNADGSFDVTSLTWADGVPSAGTSISSFSSSGIRLGSNSSGNYALIDTDSFDIYHDSTNLIHFGYGGGTTETGTTNNAPYYTLGARNTNHPTVGNYSLVEGRGNEASGYASHSEGWGNTARGSSSHAEGHNCYATGDYSHAEGFGSLAAGKCSHASGQSSYAQSDYQTVIGKCNILDNNGTYAFIIGNGINRAGQLSNAFTVDWSGNINSLGNITQNGTAVSLDGHTHTINDITSGTLPIDKGGTGDTGTSAITTASSIVTAGSGFTIESASYAQWGKLAMIHIVFKKNATAITTATNISLGTLVSGKRPKYRASAMTSWLQNALIYTDGVIHMYGTVAANASVGIYSTFILA